MASPKGTLLSLLGSLILTKATVTKVASAGPSFRLIQLQSEPKPDYQPGDKVQLMLPSKDVRTYTPMGWAADGTTELLVCLHSATTPATHWAAQVAVGDTVRMVGPQRSLRLPAGPTVLVGDETSIAVAAAYTRAHPNEVTAVLEVESVAKVAAALQAVGLDDARVFPRSATVDPALVQAIIAHPSTSVGLTGGSSLIQRVRSELRARRVGGLKPKTYWIPGKSGLD